VVTDTYSPPMQLGSYTEFGSNNKPYRRVTWKKKFAIIPRNAHSTDPDTRTLWMRKIYHCKVTDGVGCNHNYYYDLENGLMEMLKGTHNE